MCGRQIICRVGGIILVALLYSSISPAQERTALNDTASEQSSTPPDTLPVQQPLQQELTGPPAWHAMVTNVPGDWVKYYNITFREEEISTYGEIAVMTGVLMATDAETWKSSRRATLKYQTINNFSNFFANDFGDGNAQIALAGVYAAYGLALGNDRALRTASQTVQALLAGGLVVQLLKHVTGRESPYVSSSPTGIWRFFPNQFDYAKKVPHYDAFPSGHICTSMSTVVVIAENYPEYTWIRPVGYTLVGLIGISMVNIGIHWYSDYPLGIAIGYTFGMIAAHPGGYDVLHFGEDNSHAVKLSPIILPGGAGLTASVNLR